MIGIYESVHRVFATGIVDRWVRLRDSGPLFNTRTLIKGIREDRVISPSCSPNAGALLPQISYQCL